MTYKLKKPKRRGNVSVGANKGVLRITFTRQEVSPSGGLYHRRYWLQCGMQDTPHNRRKAEKVAERIQRDLAYQEFDPTLQVYKLLLAGVTPEEVERVKRRQLPELAPLWQEYTHFKAKTLEVSTIKRDYGRIARILAQLPADVDTPREVELWLLERYSTEITKRTLEALSGCFKWAVSRELAVSNPFQAIAQSIKPTKRESARTQQAFTARERAAIIAAFREHRPKYAPMIEFAFLTGCRPEELAGLQWKHITEKQIHFCEALPSDLRIRKGIKTHTPRHFPINGQLAAVIAEIRGDRTPNPESPVFSFKLGTAINTANFNRRVWNPLLRDLTERGEISRVLPLNNIRHTTWTALRESGLPPDDIARLLGHDAAVGLKHYHGDRPLPEVPEL